MACFDLSCCSLVVQFFASLFLPLGVCAVLTADFPATALLNFPAIALLGSCGNLRSTNTSFETPSFIYRLIANVIRPIAQKRVNLSMNFNIVQILSDYVEFYMFLS